MKPIFRVRGITGKGEQFDCEAPQTLSDLSDPSASGSSAMTLPDYIFLQTRSDPTTLHYNCWPSFDLYFFRIKICVILASLDTPFPTFRFLPYYFSPKLKTWQRSHF